ncbi:MAG: RHS repeat protein, partial [Desulfobacteraceae bacterium]|nr:RHS repeat protein [Desulfobacteraceae bacterium]
MPRKTLCLSALLFMLFTIASPTSAQDQTAFGPKGLTIRWWRIHLSFHHFTVDDPGDGLIIITKNTPQKKIRGGFLLLNGRFISIRSFLVGSDTVFEREISLRATNRLMVFLRGQRRASITLEVGKKSTIQPPEVTFSADPKTIEVEGSSTLSWTSNNADSATIDQGIGEVLVQGSTTVSLTETTTYTITATGPGGSATDSVTVVVVAPPEDVDQGIPEDDQQGGAGLVGETICILNGTNVESRSDLAFPSPNSLGLSFEAFYNSHSQSLGTLGYGWSHNYNTYLDPVFQIEGKDFVRIVDHTGRAHYFLEESPDFYRGVFKECTHLRIEAGDYVWYRLDGTRYGFSSSGQLLWIEDEKANRLELIYDAQNRLETVTDMATARMLTFHYNGNGLLEYIEGRVTAAVPDGIWVTYAYDNNQNLVSVTYADGSGFTYAYTDPHDIHNLTEMTDKLNHLLNTWSYDEEDRAVSKFSLQGKGVTGITYVSETQVDVTDAYGALRTYILGEVGGRKRVTALQGTPNAPYTDSNVVRWVYDDDLRLIETESANGTVNRYQDYDERGNPQTVKLAVGTPEEKVITYAYHPALNIPLSRAEVSVLTPGNKVTTWDYDDDYDPIPNENPTRLLSRIVEQGFTQDSSGISVPFYYITTVTYNAKGQVVSIDGPLPGSDDTTYFIYENVTGDL